MRSSSVFCFAAEVSSVLTISLPFSLLAFGLQHEPFPPWTDMRTHLLSQCFLHAFDFHIVCWVDVLFFPVRDLR